MAKKKNYRERLTTPFETGIRNFTEVAKYFMYYAPEIDSAQSAGGLSQDTAQNTLTAMIEKANLHGKSVFQQRIKSASWKKVNLEDDELDFENPRFLCDRYSNETELHALLRHIRNALAHGYIYVWRKKGKDNYIFVVDMNAPRNGKVSKITAKLMLSYTILEKWKAILENQIALGE